MGTIETGKKLKTNSGRTHSKMMWMIVSVGGTALEWVSNQREYSRYLYCLNILILECVNELLILYN